MNPLLDMLDANATKFKFTAEKIDRKFSDLIAEEKEAYPALRNYWQQNAFNAAACDALLTKMAAGKNKHPNDRDLLSALQDFRRLCRDYYTKDRTVYAAFQNTMRQKKMQPMPRPQTQYQPQPRTYQQPQNQQQYQQQPKYQPQQYQPQYQPQQQYQPQYQQQYQPQQQYQSQYQPNSRNDAMNRAFQWISRNIGALLAVIFIVFLVSTLISGGLVSFLFSLAFACVGTYFLQKFITNRRGGSDGRWYNTLTDYMARAGQWIWQSLYNLVRGLLNNIFR